MLRGKLGSDGGESDAVMRGPPPPAAMEGAPEGVSYIADRDMEAGEPISVWCGPQPNSKLLLNYGIVDDNNPHDRLGINVRLNPDDELFQAKRLAVQELLGTGSTSDFQLYRDAETPWSPELLPFLRIAMAEDHGELSRAHDDVHSQLSDALRAELGSSTEGCAKAAATAGAKAGRRRTGGGAAGRLLAAEGGERGATPRSRLQKPEPAPAQPRSLEETGFGDGQQRRRPLRIPRPQGRPGTQAA